MDLMVSCTVMCALAGFGISFFVADQNTIEGVEEHKFDVCSFAVYAACLRNCIKPVLKCAG